MDLDGFDLEEIGVCPVDSGTLCIVDPCYVSGEKHSFSDWHKFCEWLGEDNGNQIKEGVVFRTVHGDGRYKAYRVMGEDGMIGVFVDLR